MREASKTRRIERQLGRIGLLALLDDLGVDGFHIL